MAQQQDNGQPNAFTSPLSVGGKSSSLVFPDEYLAFSALKTAIEIKHS